MPTPTELGLLDAIHDLQARLDAPTREEWAIAGEILSPTDYQALLEMSEDEQAEYVAMLVELFNEQLKGRQRQYAGILNAEPIGEERDRELLSGSLALAVLGAVWLFDRDKQQYLKLPRPTSLEGLTTRQLREQAKPIKPEVVKDSLLTIIADDANRDLVALTDDLLKGKSSLEDWQFAAGERIRDLHYTTTLLAVGGEKGFYEPGIRLDMAAFIQGELDYLRGFAMDIELGAQSPAQIRNRIQLYGLAAKGLYEEMRLLNAEKAGYMECQRFLGVTDYHCEDCVRYAGMGRQPIGMLPAPTRLCQCRNRCLCRMEFY